MDCLARGEDQTGHVEDRWERGAEGLATLQRRKLVFVCDVCDERWRRKRRLY